MPAQAAERRMRRGKQMRSDHQAVGNMVKVLISVCLYFAQRVPYTRRTVDLSRRMKARSRWSYTWAKMVNERREEGGS